MKPDMVERANGHNKQDIPGRRPDLANIPESVSGLTIRPYEASDSQRVAQLARSNFRGPSFSLLPKNVVSAYLDANRESDIRHAVNDEGTEAYVADTGSGEISGLLLLRSNSGQSTRRNAYGDLDIRRLHVDPAAQGKGIGRTFFDLARRRATELNTAFITSHASGGSRVFFERNGWDGKTVLNHMPKRNVSALVYSCMTRVGSEELTIFPEASHLIYAGTSKSRIAHLEAETEGKILLQVMPSEEPEIEDVVETAKAKALSVGNRLKKSDGIHPIVVANDTRTDILTEGGERYGYSLINKGKPKTVREAQDNFKAMYRTSRLTKKPAPYIIRTGTYIHDPNNPENDIQSEHDVSVWLSTSALHILSHASGFRKYREELQGYGVDVTDVAAGFAVPIFFDHGWVAGLNGHPYEDLPNRDSIKEDVMHTALIGIDKNLLARRI